MFFILTLIDSTVLQHGKTNSFGITEERFTIGGSRSATPSCKALSSPLPNGKLRHRDCPDVETECYSRNRSKCGKPATLSREALQLDNGEDHHVPMSDPPFVTAPPIGAVVHPFVIPRLIAQHFDKFMSVWVFIEY